MDHPFARILRRDNGGGVGFDPATNVVRCNNAIWETALWPFHQLLWKVESDAEAQKILRAWGPPLSRAA